MILLRRLVLVRLLWFTFVDNAWLGNQVRADVGVIRAGLFVAMAAHFLAALVTPHALAARP